jgi:hypothetical protein
MNNNINIESAIVDTVNVYYTCIVHYLVILLVFIVTFNYVQLYAVTTKLLVRWKHHRYSEQSGETLSVID